MDLLEAIEKAYVVMQILRDERQVGLVKDALYQEAVSLIAEFQVFILYTCTSSLKCLTLELLYTSVLSVVCASVGNTFN